MTTRNEVLHEFGLQLCERGEDCEHFDCVGERLMAHEIAALRDRVKFLEFTLHSSNTARQQVHDAALQYLDAFRTSDFELINQRFADLLRAAAPFRTDAHAQTPA